MEENFGFLNLEGLDEGQQRDLKSLLNPLNFNPQIEFPWSDGNKDENFYSKANISSLNVHAPAFEAYVPAPIYVPAAACNSHASEIIDSHNSLSVSFNNGSNLQDTTTLTNDSHYYAAASGNTQTLPTVHQNFADAYDRCVKYSQPPKPFNGDFYSNACRTQIPVTVSSFKLNPTVSSFIPQNIESYPQPEQPSNGLHEQTQSFTTDMHESNLEQKVRGFLQDASIDKYAEEITQNGLKQGLKHKVDTVPVSVKEDTTNINTDVLKRNGVQESQPKPGRRSWADVVSRGQKPQEKVSPAKPIGDNEKSTKVINKDQENEGLLLAEDKMCLALGRHLYDLKLNFQPVLLQPRGLINRRNWCYIHATLQALLACPPFYTLLRNLPLGPGVERGKSSTPVIDSMVKITYKFSQFEKSQEELQVGQPFQPDFIYDMLRDLKSDCLKGQQEDAEEFLSFILNGMHEEMVKIIKNYEKKNHLNLENEMKENGDISDGEEEWQVIGSKHKGMVTRKVAEHKTPVSDLLGGQIKSFLTTSGSKTSASVQPFFTLQLDIQSENVTSVSEALKEMTVKEPIQGYTCAKTKQEIEAFSHIALQKLPPTLILHLKRFVYNKNGGCKKVMKKTDYPLVLEISKDMFSADVKKSQRLRQYKLFAVMYHDGEEAVKGHYISDVYNHGSQTWVRCDDRTVTAVTEDQVLSHSPPRVPYLLFYQES